MKEILLLKCGELVLKGLNRNRFEQKLVSTLQRRLAPLGSYKVHASQSTIYVRPQGDSPIEPALEAAQKVFGIVSISRAAVCEKNIDSILDIGVKYLEPYMKSAATFKVEARRSDKRFPMTSPQISAALGGALHDAYPGCKPMMEGPDLTVRVDIREDHAFVGGGRIPGAGGMPTGTNGRGLLLLSGGIDSPVAGYMMAKRGIELAAVHFFSYPYTSVEAKEKVFTLAGKLSAYAGRIIVSVVPFTDIQLEIQKHCLEDYGTILMRRFMMRIACRVAGRQNCGALITGESLGQVASQTMESLAVTDEVCTLPVFRPVIGMDKEEIVTVARRIDTLETSVLPFEDCCTVFTPRHPQTKPRLEYVLAQEQKLDVEGLISRAFEGIQRVTIEQTSRLEAKTDDM